MAKPKLNTLLPIAGVLFVLAIAGAFFIETHYFKQESILEVTQTLVAGQPIKANDLTSIVVPASAAIHGINAAYEQDILQHWSASLPIPAGSLLQTTSISIDHPKGYVTVYITPVDTPPNIAPGDTIDLLVPSPTASNEQSVLPADIPVATDVAVIDIPTASSSSSTIGLEVALPPTDVSQVVAAQAAGHISVVFSSPNQPRIPVPSYAQPVTPPSGVSTQTAG